jgi:hypothetical protein
VIAALPPPCALLAAEKRPRYGDVDGDGRRDRVTIRGRRCTTLVVQARRGTYSIRLGREYSNNAYPPTISALAPLDRHRGREIVAAVDYGACSQWLHVFTLRRGRLVQMRIPGDGYFYTWACGSGFGSLDCFGPGVLFAWGGSPRRRERTVTVQVYRARGNAFRAVGRRVVRIRYRADGRSVFPGGLFEHCR